METKIKSEVSMWNYRSSFMQLLTVTLLIVITVLVAIPFFVGSNGEFYPLTNKYQGVFLTNGRVYFGKIISQDTSEIVMTDVYYLTVQVNPNNKDTQSHRIKMVKLESELQRPEDKIILNRAVVGYIEELKSDSQVVRLLKEGGPVPDNMLSAMKDQLIKSNEARINKARINKKQVDKSQTDKTQVDKTKSKTNKQVPKGTTKS